MGNTYKIISLVIFALFITSCDNAPDPTENYSYNAFFVHPDPEKKKKYVGTVIGLSSCKYIVSTYYSKRRKFIQGDWDYICCLHTEENPCTEQHRYGEN